jgi:peptide subunit release factor RF-3
VIDHLAVLFVGNVTKFQAAQSQTASLAIAGTALAALTAGGRKVGQQMSRRCVRCAVYHGIPQFVVDLFGKMMNQLI